MTTFRIALLPGDGIGPDVTAEAVRVLRAVEARVGGFRLETQEFSIGAGQYLKSGSRCRRASSSVCPSSTRSYSVPWDCPACDGGWRGDDSAA